MTFDRNRAWAKTVAKITALKGFKDIALGAAPAPKINTKPAVAAAAPAKKKAAPAKKKAAPAKKKAVKKAAPAKKKVVKKAAPAKKKTTKRR
jgi:hypothetical protein